MDRPPVTRTPRQFSELNSLALCPNRRSGYLRSRQFALVTLGHHRATVL